MFAEPKDLQELARSLPQYLRKIEDFSYDYEIGKGGCGVVWHAIDSRSSKECAIKEVFMKNNEGEKLKRYIREVYTMAQCNHRSIIRLIGFTIEKPYSIITEFHGGGTLDRSIYGSFARNNPIQSNRLAIIAILLSHSLVHIHNKGIIHRDIKASNVLLNEKKLPILCDFGISRFFGNGIMTKRIGTALYMAPEMLSEKYDFSVDVFAFGLLLYEMSEGKRAYEDLNSEEIPELTRTRNTLPTFFKTPHPLKSLIIACIAKNPTNRPTASEVFEKLSNCECTFADVNKDIVIQKAKEILQKSTSNQNLTTLEDAEKEISRVFCTPQTQIMHRSRTKTVVRKVYRTNRRSTIGTSSESMLSKLSGTYDSKFCDDIDEIAVIIEEKFFGVFFDKCAPVFLLDNSSDSIEIITRVLKAFRYILLRNKEFLKVLFSKQFIMSLPMNNPKFIAESIGILSEFMMNYPDMVDETLMPIVYYLTDQGPYEMICLLSNFIKLNPLYSKVRPIYDTLYHKAELFFISEYGSEFVYLLYLLCEQYPEHKTERDIQLKSIFVGFLISKNKKTVIAAYQVLMICSNYLTGFDYNILYNHIQDPELKSIVISFILHREDTPISATLLLFLLEESKNNRYAQAIILRYVSNDSQKAQQIASFDSWFQQNSNSNYSFKLFMLLFSYSDIRQKIISNSSFFTNLNSFASVGDPLILTALTSLIRRCSITPDFVSNLSKSNFLSTFFGQTSQSDDSLIRNSIVILIDSLARVSYFPEIITQIPVLIEIFRDSRDQTMTYYLIVVFLTISKHRECVDILINCEVINNYFHNLLNYPEHQDRAQLYFENINK